MSDAEDMARCAAMPEVKFYLSSGKINFVVNSYDEYGAALFWLNYLDKAGRTDELGQMINVYERGFDSVPKVAFATKPTLQTMLSYREAFDSFDGDDEESGDGNAV